MIHVYKSLGTHLDFGVGGEKTQIHFLLGGKSRQREFSMVSVAHNKTRLITSILFFLVPYLPFPHADFRMPCCYFFPI